MSVPNRFAAGLGLIDAIAGLDAKSVKLQSRVGIATGLVVVGDWIGEGSTREQSIVGETPNLAVSLRSCLPRCAMRSAPESQIRSTCCRREMDSSGSWEKGFQFTFLFSLSTQPNVIVEDLLSLFL